MTGRTCLLVPIIVSIILIGAPRDASAQYYYYPKPHVSRPRTPRSTRNTKPRKTAPDPVQELWAAFFRDDVKKVQALLARPQSPSPVVVMVPAAGGNPAAAGTPTAVAVPATVQPKRAYRYLGNSKSPDGTPLLTLAIYTRHKPMIGAVINSGPDLNLTGPRGITPLDAAVWVRDEYTTNYLIAKGANLESKTTDGDTPLFFATFPDMESRWSAIVTTKKVRKDPSATTNAEMVKLLLTKKASISAVNKRGLTPLGFSLTTGNLEAFDALKAAGVKEDASLTFFDDIAHKNIDAVKKALDKNPKLATATVGGDTTALHVACLFDAVDSAKLLIDKGASVTDTTRNGTTPLHSAMWGNDKALVDLLISKGADPNSVDDAGKTPLVIALNVSSEDVLYGLLAKGADVNRIDQNNLAPLMIALNMKRYEAATILVEKGAKVKGDLGSVAMFRAEAAGDRDLLKALIDNGADVNAINEKGNTVTYQATLDRKPEIVALLKEHGGKA